MLVASDEMLSTLVASDHMRQNTCASDHMLLMPEELMARESWTGGWLARLRATTAFAQVTGLATTR